MNQPEAKDIIATAIASAEIKQWGDHGFVVFPQGYAVQPLEFLQDAPNLKRAKVTLLDKDSYIAYVTKHKFLERSVHYADVDFEQGRCIILCVIDDNGADYDDTSWRQHVANFTPKLSVEWGRWTKANKSQMQQASFSAFIEDNIQDIVSVSGSPNGTDMLGMALNFEQTSEKRFKRRIDLGTGGVQLEYVDKADDATSAKIRMFERFHIGIPVFQGSNDAYPVEARLKYRQSNDALQFWYELIRPDRVFRQAVEDTVSAIKEQTGLMMVYGNPGLKD